MDKKYLLIVEKDEELRGKLLETLKEKIEFPIITASDGVQAYQKTRNQHFAVVIVGDNLAKIDGAQLIAAMRETHHNVHTPIIMFTGNVQETKNNTRGHDLIDYFEKTENTEALIEKVKSLSVIEKSKKRFKLDVDFINPFIDSSMKTLNSLCGVNHITAKKPFLQDNQILDVDITGVLAITSPFFKGHIAISFKKPVYESIIEKIMQESHSKLDPHDTNGAAEIINIIFGQTKAILNQKGYSIERAVPSVLTGKNNNLKNNKIPVLLVPFNSEIGDFWIQIRVKAS